MLNPTISLVLRSISILVIVFGLTWLVLQDPLFLLGLIGLVAFAAFVIAVVIAWLEYFDV